MKCNNCGAELKEGEKFCAVCGQQVSGGQNIEQQASVPIPEEKPKKSRGFKIGLVAAVVAVLVVGTAAGAKVVNMIKKAAMSPAEYYQYVETNSRDNGEKLFLDYYGKLRESFAGDSFARDIRMKIQASDSAKSLLSLAGIDISNVKNLELNLLTGREGKEYSNQIALRGNDNDLLTMKTYMDLGNKKAYYQIPELSKSYLDMSSVFEERDAGELDGTDGSDTDEVAVPYSSGMLMSMYDFDKYLIETDDLKDIYERYTNLLIKKAQNVKKSEGGCEAEGISQKADKYTVTMDDGELTALVKELAETLKYDKATLTLKEDSGQKEVVIDMRCPKDGDNFGVVFAVETEEGEILNLHGKGTEKAGVINGEFVLDTDGSLNQTGNALLSAGKLLVIKVEDYDLSKYAEGKTSGTVIYSTEAAASLANYSLKIEGQGDMKESSAKVSILAGKEDLVTIDVSMKSDVKAEKTAPSGSDKIYDINDSSDMLAYQKEMDIVKLMEDVQEKLGIDFSGLLGGLLTGGMSSEPMEDYGSLSLGSGS